MYISPINHQSSSLKFNQNTKPNFKALRIKSSWYDSGVVLKWRDIRDIIAIDEKMSTIVSFEIPCTTELDLPFSVKTLTDMIKSSHIYEYIDYNPYC